MVNTMFSDSIVNATDLRTNQKYWFEKAYENAVTVNYGRRQLAIMNREQVGNLLAEKHYAELVIRACQGFIGKGESDVFPWLDILPDDEKVEFHEELLNCAIKSITTGNWTDVEYLIQDWKATAKVDSNPKLARALLAQEEPSQYVEIKR